MIELNPFFDPQTSTLTYVLWDPQTKDAVCIDPVWNFELESEKLSTRSVEEVLNFLSENHLDLKMILETHVHADHLSAAQLIKKKHPHAILAIGAGISKVQNTFKPIYEMSELHTDGRQFDRLLKDREIMPVGSLSFEVRHTPGHTPACSSYIFADHVFTGDALFMPDSGTGRCDFPNGSAEALYDSITQKIYSLPDHFKTHPGHDYQPGGRNLEFQSTVQEQKRSNIHLKAQTAKADFIKFRTERDHTLKPPKLLHPSLQVNLLGGSFPHGGIKKI